MKNQILLMALIILERNQKVTTLEVKNALHRCFENDPTFSLTQKEVSAAMTELEAEQGWEHTLDTSTGFAFKVFTLNAALKNPLPDYAVAIQQITAAQSTTNKLDPANGDFVCYVSGYPNLYVQGNSLVGLKKACFNKFKTIVVPLNYDQLNPCSFKYFQKKYGAII